MGVTVLTVPRVDGAEPSTDVYPIDAISFAEHLITHGTGGKMVLTRVLATMMTLFQVVEAVVILVGDTAAEILVTLKGPTGSTLTSTQSTRRLAVLCSLISMS